MKATFKMKAPPAGGEPVLYVELDPDDTGLNIVGHVATENDKSRFSAEFALFEEEQAEKEKNGEPAVAPQVPLADLPVTVKASMPLGREDEYAAQYRGAAPVSTTPPPVAVTLVDAPEAKADEAEATSSPLDMTVTDASPLIRDSNDAAQLKAWRKAEVKGANRSGIIAAIDHRLGDLKKS